MEINSEDFRDMIDVLFGTNMWRKNMHGVFDKRQ